MKTGVRPSADIGISQSVRSSTPGAKSLLSGIGWSLLFSALFLGVAVCAYFGGRVAGGHTASWVSHPVRGLIALGGMTFVTWLVRVKVNKRPWKGMALPLPQLSLLLPGGIVGALVVFVIFGLEYTVGWLQFIELSTGPHQGLPNVAMILVQLLPSLGTGFSEELAFRGYILQTLAERTRVWIAVLISSLLFAAVHAFSSAGLSVNIVISITLMGVSFAVMRFATGSLWFPVGFHAMFDWTQTFLLGSTPDNGYDPSLVRFHQSGPDFWMGGGRDFGLLFVLVTLISAAAVLAYGKRVSRPPKAPGVRF